MRRLREFRRVLLAAAIPLVIGLVFAGALAFEAVDALVLRIDIDLWRFVIAAAVLISLALLIVGAWHVVQMRHAQSAHTVAIEKAREVAADDRRRFLRRLDHELKNPLMAIRAGLANVPDDGATRDTVQGIDLQTQRLSRIVTDLRKLADLETQPLDRSQVNLEQVLNEAVALAQDHPNAQARRVTLSVPRAPWPVPTISGDYDLLVLAIYNLIENALKYSNESATVEVRAVEDSEAILIDVANTGSSIPEHELAQVFDELYRGEGARQVPGSGLGLALVRTVVLRHGGTIRPRSRDGQGTVFSIRLPFVTNLSQPVARL
jgi:two-component system, OmpR family, sensor kinase